nr:hypothetical protein [Tanacetum cinerariifolium]
MPTALAGSHSAETYDASNDVIGAGNFWAVTMVRSHGSALPLPLIHIQKLKASVDVDLETMMVLIWNPSVRKFVAIVIPNVLNSQLGYKDVKYQKLTTIMVEKEIGKFFRIVVYYCYCQLRSMLSLANLTQLLSNSIVVMVFGSNDNINNYLLSKLNRSSRTYNPEEFADLLLNHYRRQLLDTQRKRWDILSTTYPRTKCLLHEMLEFLENSLIDQEASGSLEDLEIIQEEDTHPSLDTSLNHEEDDLEIDEPQSDIVPIRRSTRTRHAPDRMCLYIDAEEHELGDFEEPANYKVALLDPYKWLFKKKTDMDENVHIYKAHLVTKGYTQTLGIDYEETFSPVADIRAIRILIAIAAVPSKAFLLLHLAAFDASKEAVWVRKFISRLRVVLTIEEPISMYCDNTGTIAIANESGITKEYTLNTVPTYTSIIDDNTFPQQKFPLTAPEPLSLLRYTTILGSVDGLLGFYGFYQDVDLETYMAVLWNPSLRKCVGIPIPNVLYSLYGYTRIGFGVCPRTNDPKIVKINVVKIPSICWEIQVFTLTSRVWKTVFTGAHFRSCTLMIGPVFVDGIIYWSTRDGFIVSFDLKSDKFGEVSIPERVVRTYALRVMKVNGSLGLLECNTEGEMLVCGVWMRKDGVNNPFTKIYTVKVEGKSVLFKVLGFRNNGEVIIEMGDDDFEKSQIEVYEPSSGRINGVGISGERLTFRRINSVGISGERFTFRECSYMETLLLLDQSNSIIQDKPVSYEAGIDKENDNIQPLDITAGPETLKVYKRKKFKKGQMKR